MEAEKGCGFEVPVHLTEDLDLRTRCMKGTASKHQPRCTALKGKIGEFAMCTNYEHRPSPCRNFKASFEDGTQNSRCDDARKKHGLLPLNKSYWKTYRDEAPEPTNPASEIHA